LLKKYLKEHPVDAMLSDGPPHSNTRICTLLAKDLAIPWLADFQDPWTQADYYSLLRLMKWADAKHHRMEQEVFSIADQITIVSESWKRDLESIGAKNVSVIPWGYDPDDYTALTTEIQPKFCLTHLGILGYDRIPDELFQVLAEMCRRETVFRTELQIQLVGNVDHTVRESLTTGPLQDNVIMPGSVSRSEALRLMAASPILLLLLNKQSNARGRIPGKFFEYLAVKRTILCLGPPQSDVEHILRETRSGYYHEYSDSAGIQRTLEMLFQQYRNDTLKEPVNSNIEQYSVRKLTGKVAALLDEITGTSSSS
jgi:glycosyltransferase involved in cell wall biosynthesis